MSVKPRKALSKLFTIVLAACIFASSAPHIGVNAADISTNSPTDNTVGNDEYILNDKVKNIYKGTIEAGAIIKNLNFDDVGSDNPAKEAIVRAGALNLIKGYERSFKPESYITNAEAIAIIITAIGLEAEAIMIGNSLAPLLPKDSPLGFVWSMGFIDLAATLQIITPEQYQEASIVDQSILDPETAFLRDAPAVREDVADWLYYALSTLQSGNFIKSQSIQALLTYSDWQTVSASKSLAVDALTLNGILYPDQLGRFNPRDYMTRADMAQILKNMDKIYMPIFGYVKKTGTVGAVKDEQYTTNGAATLARNVYVRTSTGEIEVLQYNLTSELNYYITDLDTVVFKNGNTAGFASLAEGDRIEYIVNQAVQSVRYINVLGNVLVSEIKGLLTQVSTDTKMIVLSDSGGKKYSYTLAEQLTAPVNGVKSLLINGKRQPIATLPFGSLIKMKLSDGIVTEITYIGEPLVLTELRGIVIENDPSFGTLTILDNSGNIQVRNYYENEMTVKKEQYYDLGMDDLGYLTEIFPYFGYDKRGTTISEIEAGDIVYLTLSKDEEASITAISAASNYSMRYGKIKQVRDNGEYTEMLVEYENKQTSWFSFSNNIFITKSGKPVPVTTVTVGDWVKLLVNEAVISAGYVMETVKEIAVEGIGHYISTVIKGNLSGIDAIQNQITIQNSQELTKNGWSNYKNLSKYSIAAKDIEFYNGSTRISLDYAVKYFKRSTATVYIALERGYSGEKVTKITFRTERDELLASDTVTQADGNGSFNILAEANSILTDAGTIVRRYGRLVDGKDIMPSDYAAISLNGQNKAAVVDIIDYPSIDALQIARGRILSVDDNRSFKVQSMSVLSGMEWVYTPVQREFSIDYNTKFITAEGILNMDTFLGYTDTSVINKVYNIVFDGSRAAYVFDAPYPSEAVKGTIYVTGDGEFSIKDAHYYDEDTGKWLLVSETNSTLIITVPQNTIIGKNNKVTDLARLEVGDEITVYTDTIPEKPVAGDSITSYIVFVNK